MRVLVIGNGAREHALLRKLKTSASVSALFVSPGNAAMQEIAECIAIDGPGKSAVKAFADLAQQYAIDLTIVGGEALLVDGLVDEFLKRDLRVFGPTAAAAQLEGSKIWAKDVMQRVGIATANWRSFVDLGAARSEAETRSWRCVVKADGLAQGKGSFVCLCEEDVDNALNELERRFPGEPVLVEELLDGQEVSVFALSDGRTVMPFGAAQDHKRLLDNDEGPNTGGMGAYSPVEHMRVAQGFAGTFFEPLIEELAARGTPYVGVLYAGAIVTSQGPKILEFNCRLGDPEAEVLLPRFDGDLADVFWKATEGQLHTLPESTWSAQEALCVVIATGSYPKPTPEEEMGVVIHGIDAAKKVDEVFVFHSGTDIDPETGEFVTKGGRILSITGLGANLEEARSRAYKAVEMISFPKMHYRSDIGTKAIGTVWTSEWRKPPQWEQSVMESSVAIGRVANELQSVVEDAKWGDATSGQLLMLRDRLYEIMLRLSPASSEQPTLGHLPQRDDLEGLTERFDKLLEEMQRPGSQVGVDAAFRRVRREQAVSTQLGDRSKS